MPKQPPEVDTSGNVRHAFSSFEQSLREMLTAEAQKSVEQAVERLSAGDQSFQITGLNVDVRIDGLSVTSGGPARPVTKARPRKAKSKSRTARRGRPAGTLRSALLDAFSSDQQQLSTDELRQHLASRGMTTTVDNLHQHLGRLVKAGELSRPSRGRYQRADS